MLDVDKFYSMHLIKKPSSGFPDFYQPYLNCVPDDERLIQHLWDIINETEKLVASLSAAQLSYRYAAGKWTIRDILLHLADCERVIIYRAMRISRADITNLPGFDENHFVAMAGANNRDTADLLTELRLYRSASIYFIQTLSDEALDCSGTANNYSISARLLVNHLYGHHRHHLNIIKERYLV